MSTTEESTQVPETVYNGQVKWFNNKQGYGFVTTLDGDMKGTDVFVHHSGLNIEKDQYKYLVQGEYVRFNLAKSATDSHEFQATNVTGAHGGSLMCEIRNANSSRDGSDRSHGRGRGRGRGRGDEEVNYSE